MIFTVWVTTRRSGVLAWNNEMPYVYLHTRSRRRYTRRRRVPSSLRSEISDIVSRLESLEVRRTVPVVPVIKIHDVNYNYFRPSPRSYVSTRPTISTSLSSESSANIWYLKDFRNPDLMYKRNDA